MVVPLGGKFTVASNISYLMKGWYEISMCSVGRAEIFFPLINADPGDYNLPFFGYVNQI